MSRFLQAGASIEQRGTEPLRDVRQNRYEWANSQRADRNMWVGPMFWPSPRMGFGACFGSDDLATPLTPIWYEQPDLNSGATGGYHLCGTTRDNTGAALGTCVVQMFRTSDDLIVNESTSGPTGEYVATSPYGSVNHYLVAYKAGGTDKTGASINTLVPTETRSI